MAYFQIRMGPVKSCTELLEVSDALFVKLDQPCTSGYFILQDDTLGIDNIHSGLVQEIKQFCPTCGLTSAHVKDDQLSCRGGLTTMIVYRARIVGTDVYSAPGLVSLMQSWLGTGRASIMFRSSRLLLDPTCDAHLDTLQSPDCPPGEWSVVTDPSVEQATELGGSDSAQAGAIAGSISAVIIAILAVLSVMLILALIMKASNSQK